MIFINKQLDRFKDGNDVVQVNKMQNAYPHLYDKDGNKIKDFFVGFDEQNENLLVETSIKDDKEIRQKVEQFIREQKQYIKAEQQKLQKQLNVYDKRIRAMNAVLSDRGLSEFTKEDCCRSMYEGTESNIGKIGIIPLSGLTNDYKKPEYQLFRLDGGFGCSPAGRGNSCFGKFCADGSEARMEKFDFIGIGNAEVEKIAQELEVGWSGGASGCAERERELDGPEM